MLNSYYTEKLLGLQGVEIKNIAENEEKYEISIEQPRKNAFVLVVAQRQIKYTTTVTKG